MYSSGGSELDEAVQVVHIAHHRPPRPPGNMRNSIILRKHASDSKLKPEGVRVSSVRWGFRAWRAPGGGPIYTAVLLRRGVPARVLPVSGSKRGLAASTAHVAILARQGRKRALFKKAALPAEGEGLFNTAR